MHACVCEHACVGGAWVRMACVRCEARACALWGMCEWHAACARVRGRGVCGAQGVWCVMRAVCACVRMECVRGVLCARVPTDLLGLGGLL